MALKPWGTWEELLLGGAVLRHGPGDWKVVAGELCARTVSPLNIMFTPEICKAKYEDLQRRYHGRKVWFDELRKKRIRELKNALEVSEDSIGSLETKLGILNAERKCHSQDSYDSSRTESGLPCLNYIGNEFSSKDTSKDGLSAGSFTQETRVKWSPECHGQTFEEMQTKPEVSESPQQLQDDSLTRSKLIEPLGIIATRLSKGRRGKRKRRNIITDANEVSIGDNLFVSLDAAQCSSLRDTSTSCSGQNVASSDGLDLTKCPRMSDYDVMSVFNRIAEHNCASVFRRRLDSQKRGRYKKMIMRHLDFDTLSSRIANGYINTPKEIFRDLLLLANNALVYYSKTTREYKSALQLRELVSRSLKQHLNGYITPATIAILSSALLLHHPPVKQRSASQDKVQVKVANVPPAKVPSKSVFSGKRVAGLLPVDEKSLSQIKLSGRRSEKQVAKGRKTIQKKRHA